jgi:hypothetical protein
MQKVNINGSVYRISWRYGTTPIEHKVKGTTITKEVPETQCLIEQVHGDGTYSFAGGSTIRLFYKDIENRAIARRTSLERALWAVFPGRAGREARRTAWQVFNNRQPVAAVALDAAG